MRELFGTDGIRGVANQPPMTPQVAWALGKALVARSAADGVTRPRVVVGRDTRLSGPMLEAALTAGVCSAGGGVIQLGVLPTPAVALMVGDLEADAGVVVSASHNPFQDNGLKVFANTGLKLTEDDEARLEALMAAEADIPAAQGDEIGWVDCAPEATRRYVEFCQRSFPGDDLAAMRIALDCANGATSSVAEEVFAGLGAEVFVINDRPDGSNINLDCGSEHTEGLSHKVVETGADVGLAFDGDGDRVIAVDETGARLTGDQVIAICAQMYRERGWLDNEAVVTTVMSNLGLRRALMAMGIDHQMAQVGDRNVVELMKEVGAVIGGEDSGHIVFHRYHTTGDGILAGLQLLGAMRSSGQPLSTLAGIMSVFPQTIINVDVTSKPPLEDIARLQEALVAAEGMLGDEGRVLVRYSGTQPMCRVMVEGMEQTLIETVATTLASAIREEIGAA